MADYIVTDTELTSVADAIRTKGGTSEPLAFPDGFTSAISNIPSGGGTDTADFIIEGQSGSYYNSTASSIREYCFYGNSSMTGIEMNCSYIGLGAFLSCSALTTASFPVCTSIGSNAFQSCRALTTASFPVCTSIGANAFNNCRALTTASFPMCSYINSRAFLSCSALTTVSFPVCTIIGSSAFISCNALTTVSFPVCTIISAGAFLYCNSLVSLYLLGSSVCTLTDVATLYYTPMSRSTYTGDFGSIYVLSSLYDSYVSATNWSVYSERFVSM